MSGYARNTIIELILSPGLERPRGLEHIIVGTGDTIAVGDNRHIA